MKPIDIISYVLILILLCAASVKSQENLQEVEVTEITSDLHRLFVNGYVHVFTFTGDDGVFLVDAGFKETVGQIQKNIEKLGDGEIRYIVYTHSDGDHTTGYDLIGEHTTLIAHPDCSRKLADNDQYPGDKLPSTTFEGTMTLNFNNEVIKLISVSGGHSTEDVIVYFENAGVVCLGDMVISDSLPFVRVQEGASIYKLTKNIETVLDIFPDGTRYFPSHGREYSKNDLRNYLNMLNSTIDIVSKEVKMGKTDEELIKKDILKDWKSWNNKKWEWINTDLWITTIHYELTQKDK
ncbi:MAG: MBL fold metallo-hydrolase [bacterium]|nr:MBL fold metallo-hydrolase [bacterium]